MTDDRPQKIQVPIADEASFLSEGAWATHLGDDRYEIDDLLGFTEGVSAGDIVRVDVLPDGQLVAVEVLERWPGPTFVFSPDTDEVGARFAWDVIGDVLDRSPAAVRCDREGLMKGSVAVRYAAEDEAWFWREARGMSPARLTGTSATHPMMRSTNGCARRCHAWGSIQMRTRSRPVA